MSEAGAPTRRRTVRSRDGVRLAVTEAGRAGEGPTVVLLHGFPDLSYTWRRQIPALAGAGYHVLAVDGRGFGRSDRPDDVGVYDIDHLTDDLLALLDDVGVDRAVFVGHDWGALVIYALALMATDRVAGAVGIGVPFLPRGTVPPTTMLRQFAGEQWFMLLWVQDPGVAEADMGRDVATTIRRMYTGLRLEAIIGSQGPGEARNLLDRLREGRLERGEALLGAMDDVYGALVVVDYPDALTNGLRRTLNALRAVLERSRGDVTTTVLQTRLQRAIERAGG